MEEQHNKRILIALGGDDVHRFVSLFLLKKYSLSDYELLCHATKSASRRIVYYLLVKGCCVSKPGSAALPLNLAMKNVKIFPNWTNVVFNLLDAGARVSDATNTGETALHVAYSEQLLDLDFWISMYMEESGVDAVTTDGLSVLHIACTRPNASYVTDLLKRHANINRQFNGCTPLYMAVKHRNHRVAEVLLKRGADIYAHDINGSTPLHLACYQRDKQMIDLILTHDGDTAYAVDNNGLTHFMVACTSSETVFAKEHLRVAEYWPGRSAKGLINSYVNRDNGCQFAGYTPINFAAEFKSGDVFNLLIDLLHPL